MIKLIKVLWGLVVSMATLLMCLLAAMVAGMTLPYFQNWPYSGLMYGGIATTVTVGYMISMRDVVRRKGGWNTSKYVSVTLMMFLIIFAMICLGPRWATEKDEAYAFATAEVVEKYKSWNHGYLSFRLRMENGQVITLENYPQEFWNRVSVGDKVSKAFRDKELTILP